MLGLGERLEVPRAQRMERLPPDDAVKPRGKRVRVCEAREPSPRRDERLLDDIAGAVGVAEDGQRRAEGQ